MVGSCSLVGGQAEFSYSEFEFLRSMILIASDDALAKKLMDEHKILNVDHGSESLLLCAVRCYEKTHQAIAYAVQINRNVDARRNLLEKQTKVIKILLRYGANLRLTESEDFINISIAQPVYSMSINSQKRIKYEPLRIIQRIQREKKKEDQERIEKIGSLMAGQAKNHPAIARRLNSMLKF